MSNKQLKFSLSAAIAVAFSVAFIGESGAVEHLNINAKYKRVTKAERREIDAALSENLRLSQAWHKQKDAGEAVPDEPPLVLSDHDFLGKVLLSWDLTDANGNPVGVDSESREAADNVLEGLTRAAVVAFFEHAWSVERVQAAAAKN